MFINATPFYSIIIYLFIYVFIYFIFQVLALPNMIILFKFVERVLHYPTFDAVVIQMLLNTYQNSYLNEENRVADINEDFLNLITLIILHKAPLSRTGMELKQWNRYPIQFR